MTQSVATLKGKSFQNCKETEIHGYNDCPSFLFQVSKKSSRKTGRKHNTLETTVQDTYGNTKLATIPPPSIGKRKISSSTITDESNGEEKLPGKATSTNKSRPQNNKSHDEIIKEIDSIINSKSKLSSREFEYYKAKVTSNLSSSLSNNSTNQIMIQFLDLKDDKKLATDFLRKWMVGDITINSWCPAFLKIFENRENDN